MSIDGGGYNGLLGQINWNDADIGLFDCDHFFLRGKALHQRTVTSLEH